MLKLPLKLPLKTKTLGGIRMSFVAVAGKKTTDIREFIRDASNTGGIRYRPEKGKKHLIYIPYNEVSVIRDGEAVKSKEIIAISGGIHEWESADGKYRNGVCLKGVYQQDEVGNILNDGTCPICDKIGDAWDIYRYRYENEERNCTLTGPEREEYLENVKRSFLTGRKAKEAREYIYLLIAQFRTDGKGGVETDEEGMPAYDLRVMKMSSSRAEAIEQQLANSGTEFAGSEITFEYPNSDDPRLVVSKSTSAPVFPDHMLTRRFPKVLESITEDVNKFSWEGIEKSFGEWNGMTNAVAEKLMSEMFEKWDEYKRELEINPDAKYLEYVGHRANDKPALNVSDVGIPDVGAEDKSDEVKIPDVNKVFSNAKASIEI